MPVRPISLLHRHVWQQLPQKWRRGLFSYATSLSAPQPTPTANSTVPIIVAGALRTASGLGESARLCHDALKAASFPVFGIDLTAALMQPEDQPDFEFSDGRALFGTGTLILHVNSPLVPLALLRLGSRLVRQKRIIGYWAWELPQVPGDWRHGIPFVHEIWVPSRFTAQAVVPIAMGRTVQVVMHPVAIKDLGPIGRRQASHPFTVLTIFNVASSFARKNPCATIEAFRMAFDRDPGVRLIVKTSHMSAFREGHNLIERARGSADNIVVIDRTLSVAEIAELYDESDVAISLHRSEGFGLTIAEAMLRGLPVVATNWSGNLDFLNNETGIPVPYRLIPAEDPQGTYQHPNMSWADADIEVAAEALHRLRHDPGLRLRLGQQAARFAFHAWSVESYAGAVRKHLGL